MIKELIALLVIIVIYNIGKIFTTILRFILDCMAVLCNKIYEIVHTDRRLKYNCKKYLNIEKMYPISNDRYMCISEDTMEYRSSTSLTNMIKMKILSMVNIQHDILNTIKKMVEIEKYMDE